jgi:hypothetical protein
MTELTMDKYVEYAELIRHDVEDEEEAGKFFEAVIREAKGLVEEADSHGVEIDIEPDNICHIDTVDVHNPYRDGRVRFWLNGCSVGRCVRTDVTVGEMHEHNKTATVVIDIREF